MLSQPFVTKYCWKKTSLIRIETTFRFIYPLVPCIQLKRICKRITQFRIKFSHSNRFFFAASGSPKDNALEEYMQIDFFFAIKRYLFEFEVVFASRLEACYLLLSPCNLRTTLFIIKNDKKRIRILLPSVVGCNVVSDSATASCGPAAVS